MTDERCLCRAELLLEDEPEILLTTEPGDDVRIEIGEAVIAADYPEYEGTYSVIPGTVEQILSTRNKVLTENITIGPIPENYGLITYNGSKITVS